MADLKITELQALAGANVAAGDELPIADISASETKKVTVTDLIGFGSALLANGTIPSAKINFAAGAIVAASLATDAVTTVKINADAVTGAKLADQSTCVVAASKAALDAVTGDFVGQLGLTTDTTKLYLWQSSTWQAVKAAGSINTISADTSGIVNITVSTSGDTATIGTSLDNTGAAAQFLAGPTGSAGAVSYRTIAGADLPTATTSAKGGVIVNGGGLTINSSTIAIDNTVTPVSDQLRKISYSAQGIITASTSVTGSDLPVATSSVVGAVRPGTGLSVDGSGVLNHTNSVTGATQNGFTFDAQGHITNATALIAADIPDIPATKITSGSLDIARVANNSVTGAKLANYAITKIGDTQPTADQIGQFFFNPLTRDLFLWDGNVFQPIGISVGEIVFAGTFDASAGAGTGLVATVTPEGTAIGLVVGQALPAAATANNRYYLVVSEAGTITSGSAPNVALAPPDIILSTGNEWTEVDVSQTITSVTANQVSFNSSGSIAAVNVQAAIEELDTEKLPKAGGTVTGQLLIGTTGSFAFEGTTDNAYETYLTAADPTADRTITFPDQNGNVIVSGNASIVNADINASAAIAFSKLAALTSANILVGNSSNVATSVAVTGDVTISNTGVTSIAAGAIVDADINASAAIADSKLATISTAGKVSNSATTATNANTASAIVARDASGNFSAGTITAALSGTASAATALATARNIQGVAFDGTANITVVTAGTGISVAGTAVANTGVLSVNGSTGAVTNVAVTNAAQSFTAAQRGSITALTDGATITPDFAVANNFSVTLGGNRTLANPTNLTAGQSGCIWITQDGTGSRTLAYGSSWDFTGGTAPTLTTTASARDCLVYSVQSTTQITATLITNLS